VVVIPIDETVQDGIVHRVDGIQRCICGGKYGLKSPAGPREESGRVESRGGSVHVKCEKRVSVVRDDLKLSVGTDTAKDRRRERSRVVNVLGKPAVGVTVESPTITSKVITLSALLKLVK